MHQRYDTAPSPSSIRALPSNPRGSASHPGTDGQSRWPIPTAGPETPVLKMKEPARIPSNPWLPADVPPADPSAIDALIRLLSRGPCALLTGAGCSTESGIPDYRGPITGRRARSPLTWQQFSRHEHIRQRYWARAMRGWPRFSQARPNLAHAAIAQLQRDGAIGGVITQNVDALHQRAGARDVIELHGSLHRVVCTECGRVEPRDDVQTRLSLENPGWYESTIELAPDGDADIPDEAIRDFRLVGCRWCGGVLKPGVVMFGENVQREVRNQAFQCADASASLLIVGSSLHVYSGYRFVLRAARAAIPVAMINLGPPARGLEACDLVINGLCGEVLQSVARELASR